MIELDHSKSLFNISRHFQTKKSVNTLNLLTVPQTKLMDLQLFYSQLPCYEGKESSVMKELFKFLKDHKNPMIQELVNSSYEHCFRTEMESVLGEGDLMDSQDCGTEKVTRVWLTNSTFSSTLQLSITKLQDAKLEIDMFGFQEDNRHSADKEARLSDKLTVHVNDIGIAMKKMEYALFCGKVYKKFPSAMYTYAYKCEVRVFINSLAANEFFKARLLKDMRKIILLTYFLTQTARWYVQSPSITI